MAEPRFTQAQVIAALEQVGGVQLAAASILGCDRKTVERYAKRHPKIKEAIVAARDTTTDLAHVGLLQKIQAGDLTAIIFWLKCFGKDRGFIDRPYPGVGAEGGVERETVIVIHGGPTPRPPGYED